jgi:hypothetical protein
MWTSIVHFARHLGCANCDEKGGGEIDARKALDRLGRGCWDYDPTPVAMVLYRAFRVVPSVVRPAIVTTAIRAAMRPYSIAVGPLQSFAIPRMNLIMSLLPGDVAKTSKDERDIINRT